MKKYILMAILLHSLLFFKFNNTKTLGTDMGIKSTIPISYNIVNAPQNIDSMKMNKIFKNIQNEETKKEIKEVEQKIEKPEIKSKMSNNKPKKTPEENKQEKKQSTKKTQNRNSDKSKKENSEKKLNSNDVFTENGNFMANSDGSYTAISAKGISFEIINQVDPDYPRQAEMIRYNKTVVIEARFLVGLNGNIEDIQILKSHEKLGFDKEVINALKKWKFKPIIYHNKNIKVYFNKEFVFEPKS